MFRSVSKFVDEATFINIELNLEEVAARMKISIDATKFKLLPFQQLRKQLNI